MEKNVKVKSGHVFVVLGTRVRWVGVSGDTLI